VSGGCGRATAKGWRWAKASGRRRRAAWWLRSVLREPQDERDGAWCGEGGAGRGQWGAHILTTVARRCSSMPFEQYTAIWIA